MREWKVIFYEKGSDIRFDLREYKKDVGMVGYTSNDCNMTNFIPRIGEKVEFIIDGQEKTYEVINVTYDTYRQDIRVDVVKL